jgi:hypothetical protein
MARTDSRGIPTAASVRTYHRVRGSNLARRHCQFPGCYRIIPDRFRDGFCDEHRAEGRLERDRVRMRDYRVRRALREGRRPRPRSSLIWPYRG